MKIKITIVIFFVGFLLPSCSTGLPSPELTAQQAAQTEDILLFNSSEVAPANTTVITTATEEAMLPPPQVTITSTAPELEPADPTPTSQPSATPPHPLTIEYLRQGDFPGSEIIIEEVLEPGLNYNRYIASYMSEGLKINALLTVPFGEKPPGGWPAIIFNHGYMFRLTEEHALAAWRGELRPLPGTMIRIVWGLCGTKNI